MNKKLVSFCFSALTLIALQACNDDEAAPEENLLENSFTFNETTYPLEHGSLRSIQTEYHPETNAKVDEWDIILSSGTLDEKKHWVRFILNSSDNGNVPLGTYTYDEAYSMDDFTFYITNIARDMDFDAPEDGSLDTNPDIESGSITIEKSGATYVISFALQLDGGDASTGSFTGELTLKEPLISE